MNKVQYILFTPSILNPETALVKLVAFVYKQPIIYNSTATEFIVYYGIWCILRTNFSYGMAWPYLDLIKIDEDIFVFFRLKSV